MGLTITQTKISCVVEELRPAHPPKSFFEIFAGEKCTSMKQLYGFINSEVKNNGE